MGESGVTQKVKKASDSITDFVWAVGDQLWGLENQLYCHLCPSPIDGFTGMVRPQGDPFFAERAAILFTKLFREPPVKFKAEFVNAC